MKDTKLIDVHCHLLTKEYTDALHQYGREKEDGFLIPQWNEELQMEYMEKAGLSHAVLSVSSPDPYFGDAVLDCEIARGLNEKGAELKKKYPEKISFAAALPLPHLDEAIREAQYAYDHLGACAVRFPSNAGGVYPGDERLDPLMEYLNSRHAVIIFHPTAPPAVPQGCFTGKLLPLMEFLGDTTRAVVNLMTSGTLQKYPNLKMIIPHCASFLPNIIDRLEGITALLEKNGIGHAVHPEECLPQLYFDLAGDIFPRGAAILRLLADADHILFGGDFPYTPSPMISAKREQIMQSDMFSDCLDRICYKNAERLLQIM